MFLKGSEENWPVGFCLVLGIIVFVIRALTSGSAYYVDGPLHVHAILTHTYTIQPPGYWLFTRAGGLIFSLFHVSTPDRALSVMNWTFSALGCMVFYLCARRLVSRPYAELGAILYAVIFFAWFSGDIQSSYASQLLFPPLTFYLMLRYEESQRMPWAIAVACSYSCGAGFRPSDGLFLMPLIIFFALKLKIEHRIYFAILVVCLCLAWFIPNQIALHRYIHSSRSGQLSSVAHGAILLGRFNRYSLSAALRILLTLGLALGPCVLFWRYARGPRVLWLLLWIMPAFAFFLLVYYSEALYLDCVLAGLVLLCLTGMQRSGLRRLAVACLVWAIVTNANFFLAFRPIQSPSEPARVINKYYGNFSLYGLRHHYWIKHLED